MPSTLQNAIESMLSAQRNSHAQSWEFVNQPQPSVRVAAGTAAGSELTDSYYPPPDTVSMVWRNPSTSSNDARRIAPELITAPAPPCTKNHRPAARALRQDIRLAA